MKYVGALTDVSVTDIKVDLTWIAYDSEDALLNDFGPRAVLVWTVLFMIIPWLFYDILPLAILLAAAFVLAALSQVNKYPLALLLFGQVTDVDFFVMLIPLIGGAVRAVGRLGDNTGRVVEGITTDDVSMFAETGTIAATTVDRDIHTATTSQEVGIDAVGTLVSFLLKLTIILVISLAAFSTMSPQRLNKGMLRLDILRQFTFAIAYGCRMIPPFIEGYHALINSFHLRSEVPEKQGLLRWCYSSYLLTLSVKAFYPLIFNVAKRSRVNTEATETKGLSRSLGDEQSQALRTKGMMIRTRDVTSVFGSLLFVVAVWVFT